MCEKTNYNSSNPLIDKCMRKLLTYIDSDYNIIACCCGHGKYDMSIILESQGHIFDIMSQAVIPRKRRFYKRDKEGYYYIPEVCDER